MKYEGVTFVAEAVAKMTKEEFIDLHIDVLWLDRKKPTRKKMLADVFDRIVGKQEEAE